MQFLDPFPEHSENVPNSDDNVTLSTSSSSSSSDITLDSICEEMVESIFCEEEEFLDSEKHNEKCYIGIASTFNDTGHILYANSIQCSTFFQYDIFYLYSYLHEYSIFDIHSMRGGNIDIMKLFILDDFYTVIIKTHWLRLIQRHWKRKYLNRKNIIKIRASPLTISFFEKNGKYPETCRDMPSIRGMLSCYK